MPTITIIDQDRSFDTEVGVNLMQAISSAGLPLTHACGGNCVCGTCGIRILESDLPLPPACDSEAHILGRIVWREEGVRLSCQVFIEGDLTIRLRPKH